MIKIESIKFKNFLSYGNSFTEFNFEDGVTRIYGENGNGKSALVEALYFGLFGKPYRNINMAQLINTINKKELEVVVELSVNSSSYTIERGLKPNFLKVYKDGKEPQHLIPVPSSNRTYQQILEEDHLKISPNIFDQTMMKSLTKNVSFLTLTKDKKREVVETIMDTRIYTEMNKIAKLKADAIEKEIQSLKKDLEYTQLMIDQEAQNINRLKAIKHEMEKDQTEKIKAIESEIEVLTNDIEKFKLGFDKINKHKDRKVKLTTSRAEFKSAYDTNDKAIRDAGNKITVVREKVTFLKNTCGDCPKIKDIVVNENVEDLIASKKLLEQANENLANKIREIDTDIGKCDEIIKYENTLNVQIRNAETNIQQKRKTILSEQNKTIEINDNKLKELQQKHNDMGEQYNSKCDAKKYYVFARSLLTEDAIKAHVVKKYLPTMNMLLNMYLQKFGSDIVFEFDSEFNEIIKSRHKESYSYESFSEGQKRRIDLSILFMFIKFCNLKSKQSESNLLILDEIGAGLDINKENAVYELLKLWTLEENKRIITISHNGNIDPQFIDNMYSVTMDTGFSTINNIGKGV